MIVTIPTSKEKYFRQGRELITIAPPLDKLSRTELDVAG